jgi:hypothetical protein
MSVIYSAATKTARLNAVVTTIGANGKLKLLTAADAVLATIPLAATAGTVSGDVLTFSDANGATAGISNVAASAQGIIAKAIITTSADVTVISGLTAGTSGTDVIVDNTNVNVGQNIQINTATITHAA